MRYAKATTSLSGTRAYRRRPMVAKWYDVREFLELRDVEDDHRPPLPPPRTPIPGDFAYHRPGLPLRLK